MGGRNMLDSIKEVYKPCPLFEEEFTGPCQNCNQRVECMMLTVLRKLDSLEQRLDMASSPLTMK
jgi:hypothetical protein